MRGVAARAIVLALVVSLAGCVSTRLTVISSFVSADGDFTVTVPGGAMAESTSAGSGPFVGGTVHAFVHDEPDGPRFALLYADAAPNYLAGTSLDAALDAAELANIRATGGAQVDERHITITGLPAREQRITTPAASYVFRMVFAGNRLYSISVKGTDLQVQEADVIVYFDSFTITP